MAFMKRVRLDDELISQGICADRADALRTLMAGLVSSGGERLTSPGLKVTPGLPLHVKGRIPYVGRGGLKLEGALDAFGIDPTDLACLDVGCSTGGFTDCLLKRGAATVVSVDVGRAQFDWSLRQDDRVTLHERTNVTQLPELGYGGCYRSGRVRCVVYKYREYHRRRAGVPEAFGFVLHARKAAV